MKINLAKNLGFCFGVKRALKLTEEVLKDNKNVFILNPLVHNELVMKELEKKGLKQVKFLKEIPENSILILPAHGTNPDLIREAKKRKLKLIDCTCPFLLEIHEKIRELEKSKYFLVIIGDKIHAETKAIKAQVKKALIVENIEDVKQFKKELNQKKIGIVFQSTQDLEQVFEIILEIFKDAQELRIFNTICKPTQSRQQEVKKLAKENDVVLVIGSKTSANTNRLYRISKKINPFTYLISEPLEIPVDKIVSNTKVAIISGSSTPPFLIDKVVEYLKKN